MALLMLRRGWPGTFRRSIRDEKGSVIRSVEFLKDEPQEVSSGELPAFLPDIDNALVPVRIDETGRIRVIDTKETPVSEWGEMSFPAEKPIAPESSSGSGDQKPQPPKKSTKKPPAETE